MTNKPDTLGGYIKRILDVNRDGQITFKDFLSLFPNNAIAIAVLFVDLVVIVAEYRVWDVGMKITGGDIYKAMGFVLVSGVPFYLGQLFWLYPRAVTFQKFVALIFLGGGLYTSALFGLADLSQQYDVAMIVSMVIRLTVGYIVLALLFILMDPGIKAWRAKVTAHAAVELEKEFQSLTRSMLKEWQETKNMERETIDLFNGDEEAVIAQLNALRGKQGKPVYAQTAPKVKDYSNDGQYPNWKLDDLLTKLNLTRADAEKIVAGTRDHDEGYKALLKHGLGDVEISKSNFNNLYYQLKPKVRNP